MVGKAVFMKYISKMCNNKASIKVDKGHGLSLPITMRFYDSIVNHYIL